MLMGYKEGLEVNHKECSLPQKIGASYATEAIIAVL